MVLLLCRWLYHKIQRSLVEGLVVLRSLFNFSWFSFGYSRFYFYLNIDIFKSMLLVLLFLFLMMKLFLYKYLLLYDTLCSLFLSFLYLSHIIDSTLLSGLFSFKCLVECRNWGLEVAVQPDPCCWVRVREICWYRKWIRWVVAWLLCFCLFLVFLWKDCVGENAVPMLVLFCCF